MKFDWPGLIAAILAFALGFTLMLGVAGAVWAGRPVGEKGGEVLVGIFAVMGGLLAAYFANVFHRNNNKNDKEH